MSIYDNDTKICPDLNPSAPQEPQTYRLKKLTETEAFFFLWNLDPQVGGVKKETIKYNYRYRRHRLNYLSSDCRGASIPAFVSDVGLPLGATLSELGVVLSFLTVATPKVSRSQKVEQGKDDAIMLLAQSELDSIADLISQAMQDGDISPTEFHKVLQEREKYRKLKADIRNRTKAKVKQVEKEQREEILE